MYKPVALAAVVALAGACGPVPERVLAGSTFRSELITDGDSIFWATDSEIVSFTPGSSASTSVVAAEGAVQLSASQQKLFWSDGSISQGGRLFGMGLPDGEPIQLGGERVWRIAADGPRLWHTNFGGIGSFEADANGSFVAVTTNGPPFSADSFAPLVVRGEDLLIASEERLALLPKVGGAVRFLDVSSREYVADEDAIFALRVLEGDVRASELARVDPQTGEATRLSSVEQDVSGDLAETPDALYWWESKSIGGACFVFCEDLPFEDNDPAAAWLMRSDKQDGGRSTVLELEDSKRADHLVAVDGALFWTQGGTELWSVRID